MKSSARDAGRSTHLIPALFSVALLVVLSLAPLEARAGEDATGDGTATGADLSSGQTTVGQVAPPADSQVGQKRCSTSLAMQEYVAVCSPNSRLFWRPSPNRGGSSR